MSTKGKVINCRAAVVNVPNGEFIIETVQVAPPKDGEIRVKMVSTGLCHSDLHFLEGDFPDHPFPTVLGHEGAGIVESIGQGVKDIRPGDVVIPLFEGYCGECDACKHPNAVQCLKQPRDGLQMDKTSRISRNGESLSQMCAISTFSEYTVMAEMNAVKVNPKAPVNRLCLAGCCIPTGYGAVMKRAKVKPGTTCAIWGLGGVGMNVVLGCKESKAAKIIGVDINPSKFALAKELGCTDVLNPIDHPEGVPKALADMTNGGVDYCFVSVGVLSAMQEAFESCHPFWGETVVIGLVQQGIKLQIGVWDLLFGRQLKGTYFGSYKAKLEIPSIVDKIVKGTIPLNKLITHVLPLDDINEGFRLLKSGEAIRAVIDFDLKK